MASSSSELKEVDKSSESFLEQRGWGHQYPGLVKTLGSFPEVLSSVSEDFLSASIINSSTKAAVVSHSGENGAQLLLEALHLKLQQSKEFEEVAIALLKKQSDLKDVFIKTELQELKKKPSLLEVVPSGSGFPSSKGSPRGSPLASPLLKRQPAIPVPDKVSSRELAESFDGLLDKFITLAPPYFDFLKVKVSFCLHYAHHDRPEMEKIISEFDRCPSVKKAVRYLIDLGLLNHLNFQFLRFFQNPEFLNYLQKHEEKYRLFLDTNVFDSVAQEMGGATTSDTSKEGSSILPEMKVVLRNPWGTYVLSRWVEKFRDSVDWSEYIMMKGVTKTPSSIIITYQILPFILSKVVEYIGEPKNVKEFDKLGVAFELSQVTIDQGINEAMIMKSQIKTSRLEIIREDPSSDKTPTITPEGVTLSIHSYVFLTPLQDNFKCKVCYGVLKKTIYLDCCGKFICQGCNRSNECPYCRNTNHKSVLRKKYDEKIMNLKVQCIDNGCHWTGRLGDLNGHKCPVSEIEQRKQRENQEMNERTAKTDQKIIGERKKIEKHKSLSFEKQKSIDVGSSTRGSPDNVVTKALPNGQYTYTVSGPSRKEIDWQDKGVITLVIPAGAIPPGVSCDISIKPIQPSQCTFPIDMVLVSELFEVTASCDTKEQIEMKLRHCVALNDSDHLNCLAFIKAQHEDMMYPFKKHEGGSFTLGSDYGHLWCRSFSGFGIGWLRRKFSKKSTMIPLRCCALLVHSYNERKRKHCAHVVVTKDNGDLIMKTAQSRLQPDDLPDTSPQKIVLEQNKLTVTCEDKAVIPHKDPSELSRKDIEDYNDPANGPSPPWLNYFIPVNKISSSSLPKFPFKFEGVTEPCTMNLFVDLPVPVTNQIATDGAPDSSYGSMSSSLEESSGEYLTRRDHTEVYKMVQSLKLKWMNLGMELGIPYTPDLQAIDREKSTFDEKLMEMLSVWLKRGGREGQPIPTWRMLYTKVEALDRNIADDIARDHPSVLLENGHNETEEEHDGDTLHILDQEPSLKLFMRHIGMKNTNRADELGQCLGFTKDELIGITKDQSSSAKILRIYEAWEKRQSEEFTWNTLIRDLRQMNIRKEDVREWREGLIDELRQTTAT